MAFTAAELNSIANSSLDFYFNKGEAFKLSIQKKPVLNWLENGKKTFPGGKGNISLGVIGQYGAGGVNDGVKGFTHNDKVTFYTPANNQRLNYPWREHHIGISLTHTELKIDGISVMSSNGESLRNHSRREMTVLIGLLESKLFDMGERYATTMNNLLWGDGSGDAKALAGIQFLISEDPSVGTIGGLSRATYAYMRNRARTAAFGAKVTATPSLSAHGGDAVTSNTADGGALLTVLDQEYRQLIRFGGKPTKFFAGSDFIGAMEKEMRANGLYSQTGFASGGDVSMGALNYKGTVIEYDPTLDTLGFAKRAYWLDGRAITLQAMENEWRRSHTPERAPDEFVMYRSMTCTGQLVGQQFDSSLVIDIK